MHKWLAAVAAFVIAYFAVDYGMDWYRSRAVSGNVAETVDQLRQEAQRKSPNEPLSEGMRQVAAARASEQLEKEQDPQKRSLTAASNFMGFYLVNSRERPAFCKEHGVDIAQFVSAFQQQHANELAKARAALSRADISEDKLYALLGGQFRQLIAQDMADVAAMNKVTLKQACALIADNALAVATEMHISKMQPTVHRALLTSP